MSVLVITTYFIIPFIVLPGTIGSFAEGSATALSACVRFLITCIVWYCLNKAILYYAERKKERK